MLIKVRAGSDWSSESPIRLGVGSSDLNPRRRKSKHRPKGQVDQQNSARGCASSAVPLSFAGVVSKMRPFVPATGWVPKGTFQGHFSFHSMAGRDRLPAVYKKLTEGGCACHRTRIRG